MSSTGSTSASPAASWASSSDDGRGVLWTFTVQRFAPKSPPYVVPEGGFTAFVVGYVEIGDRRIEGVIDLDDPSQARIGMALERAPGLGVPHFRPVHR